MKYRYKAMYTSDILFGKHCDVCEKLDQGTMILVDVYRYDDVNNVGDSGVIYYYCKHCIPNIKVAEEYTKMQVEL